LNYSIEKSDDGYLIYYRRFGLKGKNYFR